MIHNSLAQHHHKVLSTDISHDFLSAQVPHEDRRPDREDSEHDALRSCPQAVLGARERPGKAGSLRRGKRHRIDTLVHREMSTIIYLKRINMTSFCFF